MADLNVNRLSSANTSIQKIETTGEDPSKAIVGGEIVDLDNDEPTMTTNSYGDYLNKHNQRVWGKDYAGTCNSKSDVLESQAAACVVIAFFDWAFHGFD